MNRGRDNDQRMQIPRGLFDTPLIAFALTLLVPLIVALA
jgi:hypothetical protein